MEASLNTATRQGGKQGVEEGPVEGIPDKATPHR
jgi:hypothetical protein